jgi:hypothetical protein
MPWAAAPPTLYTGNEVRFQQVEDCASEIIHSALRPCPARSIQMRQSHLSRPASSSESARLPVEQVVEVALKLPPDLYPAKVRDPAGTEIDFGGGRSPHPVSRSTLDS